MLSSLYHISLLGSMCVCCLRVCASLCWVCVCDVFLFEVPVLSGVHMAACMCDKPRAWGLLSSPQFSKLHKHLRETRAWAMGSPCWRPLELTVWTGAPVRSCGFPRFHPRWRHQRCPQYKPAPSSLSVPSHSDWGLVITSLWCVSLKTGDHAGFTTYLQGPAPGLAPSVFVE